MSQECDFCCDPDPDMMTCDRCGKNFCVNCEPWRTDDDPIDLCTDCFEEPTR